MNKGERNRGETRRELCARLGLTKDECSRDPARAVMDILVPHIDTPAVESANSYNSHEGGTKPQCMGGQHSFTATRMARQMISHEARATAEDGEVADRGALVSSGIANAEDSQQYDADAGGDRDPNHGVPRNAVGTELATRRTRGKKRLKRCWHEATARIQIYGRGGTASTATLIGMFQRAMHYFSTKSKHLDARADTTLAVNVPRFQPHAGARKVQCAGGQ